MTLWGGRFAGGLDPAAWALNASISFDRRLALQDVRGSQAWAQALAAAGVLTADESARLCAGLETVRGEFESGEFAFQESDEDIHTAVERRLGELLGPLAGKLHTGRSRNDQVATDLRLWLLEALPRLEQAISGLQAALLARAHGDAGILMPGYTHLQRAQPVLLSHWWLSHFWPLQRDRIRLGQLRGQTAVLPLGAGALAGTPFPVDRAALAQALGFDRPAPNSLDAVADRDFAVEFLFDAALAGVHLSKLAEAVILFTTAEFGFFELADAYATGSSLMPQKKNPDVFELARGKSGTLIGALTGLLTTLKGLPSTYDKDLQEDKLPLFTAYDTLTALLPVLSGAISSLAVQPERMRAGLDGGMMATDLADYLVAKGVPFRQAHALAGQAVRAAAAQGCGLEALPLAAFQQLAPAFAADGLGADVFGAGVFGADVFGADVYQVFDPQHSVERRAAAGGTAPAAVAEQINQARLSLAQRFT